MEEYITSILNCLASTFFVFSIIRQLFIDFLQEKIDLKKSVEENLYGSYDI